MYKPVVLVVQLHAHLEKIQFGGILLGAFCVLLGAHCFAFHILFKVKL